MPSLFDPAAHNDDPAWDLEMELLTMPGRGGDVAQMTRLCHKIDRACTDVPVHVQQLAKIWKGQNHERDLHFWVSRQPWRELLPTVYDFEVA